MWIWISGLGGLRDIVRECQVHELCVHRALCVFFIAWSECDFSVSTRACVILSFTC